MACNSGAGLGNLVHHGWAQIFFGGGGLVMKNNWLLLLRLEGCCSLQ